jgi:hypothetical protein
MEIVIHLGTVEFKSKSSTLSTDVRGADALHKKF